MSKSQKHSPDLEDFGRHLGDFQPKYLRFRQKIFHTKNDGLWHTVQFTLNAPSPLLRSNLTESENIKIVRISILPYEMEKNITAL